MPYNCETKDLYFIETDQNGLQKLVPYITYTQNCMLGEGRVGRVMLSSSDSLMLSEMCRSLVPNLE